MGKDCNRRGFRSTNFLYVVILCLLLSPATGFAQTKRINLELKNVTVQEAVTSLNRTENYSILVSSDEVDLNKRISVSAQNATIREILDQVFAGQEVNCTINGNRIIVTKRQSAPMAETPTAPDDSVYGRVTDTKGQPIIAATVTIEGSQKGTLTGADGTFELTEVTFPAQLNISYLGYITQTATIEQGGGNLPLNIVLKESDNLMDEVVVVGYGTQRRANLSGAVATISGKDLNARPVVSAANALQGADPSVNITFGTGSPESSYSINIRGSISLNSGSPLVLADGVEVSLSQINPNDIESVSVLKDASSCAIYGAKASAGVILVTTKKGAAGKATVSYSNNIGWTQPTTPTDFITNGYDYATIVNDLYFSRYAYNAFNYTDADWAALEARRYDTTEHPDRPWVVIGDDGKYHYYGNFDWYHSIYNTNRFHQEHNLSLSGGGKDVNYYVSGRYYQQDGVLGGNMIRNKENYKNYSFRAKFDAQLFKWAKWSTNASLNAVNQKYPGPLNEAQTIAALEENVAPMFVPYNPDGSIVMYPADLRNVALGKGRTAALADPTNKHTIENLSLTLSNSLQLKLHKDLTFDASYNINNYRRLYKDRTAANIYSDAVGVTKTTTHYQKDTYRERPYEYTYHNVDAYFTYEHSWNKEHNFKAVAGMNYEKYRLVDNIVEQFGLGSDQIDSFNSVNDDTYWLVQQDISAYKTLGFFARINYDYKGKYLFEASMRADGTSRFAKKDRWGYFPSVSAGWRFTEERFMEGVRHWWDNGKIRLSYGALGNQQVSNYLYLQTIGTGTLNYLFDDSGKASYASVSDPMSSNLTWETVYTYNLGLDLSFLQNRLSFTGDFFIRDTKDMLTQSLTLPSVYGAATPTENCADLRTKGWELSITWRDQFKLGGKPFNYSLRAMLWDSRSWITDYYNETGDLTTYYKGMEIGEIWGFRTAGIYASNAEALNGPAYNFFKNGEMFRAYAGDLRFVDVDGDGIMTKGNRTLSNHGDMEIIGNQSPRYQYSINMSLNWNGIGLSMLWQGVGKRDWYPWTESGFFWGKWNRAYNSLMKTQTGDRVVKIDKSTDNWRVTNMDKNPYWTRMVSLAANRNDGPLTWENDHYLQDASYIRLKNITVDYTFPKHICKKLRIEGLKIYVSGENLFTHSPMFKYTDMFDPEVITSGDSDFASTQKSGLGGTGNGYSYPMLKTVTLGVNVTF